MRPNCGNWGAVDTWELSSERAKQPASKILALA